MTPNEFRAKWTGHELKEHSAYQSHFNDLCRLVGHPAPVEADPRGEYFTFEYGAKKLEGTQGFAVLAATAWHIVERAFPGGEKPSPKRSQGPR